MSILANLEAVPNRIRALARLVAVYGPMDRDEAKARMVPVGEGSLFSGLVREAVRLGLIDDRDKLALPSTVTKDQITDDGAFVELVEARLFSDGNEPESHNYPVAGALAWLLTRKPNLSLKWNGEHNSAIRADLHGDDTYDITNSSRGAMLGYWARFLGYASATANGGVKMIIPDPTNAVARRLDKVFATKKELPVGLFVSQLAKLCPVLEEGAIRSQVEKRLKKPRNENTLSSSTSIALLRLVRRGTLGLESPSDAKVILLDLLEGNTQRVSHIRRGGSS